MDAIARGMTASPDRAQKMDFAYFVWMEPYVMVVPRPGEEPRFFAIIKPFQPIVIIISSFTSSCRVIIIFVLYWKGVVAYFTNSSCRDQFHEPILVVLLYRH